MRLHGKNLARLHGLSRRRHSGHDLLQARLEDNRVVLLRVRTLLAEALTKKTKITPAGEWLMDNFYLIEEQILAIRKLLPKGYSRELPLLGNGPSAGFPRVYDIALEMISHGDGRVDLESLNSFLLSYQSVSELRLGELWAIPIMLRLALIENLRRVASRIASDMKNQNEANYWADRMFDMAGKDPKSLILEIAEMVRSDPPMVSAFVAELSRRLQGQSPGLALPLTWIEQRLLESGATIKQLVQSEIQQQAADQVSMSNSIGGLRTLAMVDWHEFVESMSHVDQTLGEDPGGCYRSMDFPTRDSYRHVVERVAKASRLTEAEVARKAVFLASEALEHGSDRLAHVGYYLVDDGLAILEESLKARLSLAGVLARAIHRHPLFFYLGSALALSAAMAGGFIFAAREAGSKGLVFVLFSCCLAALMTQPAMSLVNWAVTLLARPQLLPRMDFSKGIPPGSRTIVVVPTMLEELPKVDKLVEALELRYLANQDENLLYALLTDYPDADQETMPADRERLEHASKEISRLNAKYREPFGDRFFLFHRPRRWNQGERRWMGHERKRGKLSDLNGYLRGSSPESFSLITGNTDLLAGIKYVITLDTDTQLQRETAREFAAAMAHPLNRPVFDASKARVTKGYGIIQPKVAMILQGGNRSRYAMLRGSEPGIDPYTRTDSDVYQDLFREGSFIGKGIYDIDAFEQALKGVLPENRILSHDLLEGCYARSGLLSDVQLLEEYPSRYENDVSRRRRWIRGDWQLLRWLSLSVPGPDGRRRKNPLSGLSRWKIADNLRRSLIPLAFLSSLLLGWISLPAAWYWTAAIIGLFALPSAVIALVDLLRRPEDMPWLRHSLAWVGSAGRKLAEDAFSLACLPHEAYYGTKEALRSIWRMGVSHRRLLEWKTSAESAKDERSGLPGTLRSMWFAPVLAAVAGVLIWRCRPAIHWVAWAVAGLWLLSPAIAWLISRPLSRKMPGLASGQEGFLRGLSRRTWAFFETFAGPEDNWLPPDNFQEEPVAVVAHRTSPTNIGLSLLANLGAHDFGYIGSRECLERTSRTLSAMDRLERFNGHFYNWYDTRSLDPLPPLYVSTVDSGNLAAYLLVLESGLRELPEETILGPRLFEGLMDTLDVLSGCEPAGASEQLKRMRAHIEKALAEAPLPLSGARRCLERLSAAAIGLADSMHCGAEDPASWWMEAFARQSRAALEELDFLAPWSAVEKLTARRAGPDSVPTLKSLAMGEVGFADDAEAGPLAALACQRAKERMAAIEALAIHSAELARMDYGFLYDKERHLLSIGYNIADRRRDMSFYDLLASEARLCSFVAIAQGQIPQENWFALGRQLTLAARRPALLSWSGSMFEYLMPLLVMPSYESSLLDQTYGSIVARQMEYGRQRSVPWGISESGYFLMDASLNYQYRAFGVPGLGLKRGLAEDLVVSPYSSALALMIAPAEACANLRRLAGEGLSGRYGLYEAIDYSPSRSLPGSAGTVVRSFMAHHQGMAFLALACLLLERPMQRRFRKEAIFAAAEPLLQERVPKGTAMLSHTTEMPEFRPSMYGTESPVRVFADPTTPMPEVQLLSNGRYSVMLTNAGGGYSTWNALALTRWREDGTCDAWGSFCYLKDLASGSFWSSAFQPTRAAPKSYEAIFAEGRAEYRRNDFGIDSHTSIVVSPEDDIELRRISVTNRSRIRRDLEFTSYSEVVIAPQAADAQHPAFGNLFVQTEIDPAHRAILCHRRPRSPAEDTPWLFHLVTASCPETAETSYETDRERFIGRWNTLASPRAMTEEGPLSGSSGSVLDPIVSIRHRITLEPEETATIDIITGLCENRTKAQLLIAKYQDRSLADRVFDLAYTHSQVVLRQLNVTEADAQLYCRLAGPIIFSQASMRADPGLISRNHRGQSGLWGYSISGDVPIVLLKIEDPANIILARQLIQAHAYWRLKDLVVDLVIWNEDHAGYRQLLYDQIMGLLATGAEGSTSDKPGGVFVRSSDQISMEDRVLIQSVARVIISDTRGSLVEQVNRRAVGRKPLPMLAPVRALLAPPSAEAAKPRSDLLFFNGLGGFTADAKEYIITTAQGQIPPAPWVNVLANPSFGTVISEAGQSYTWAENSHEFRLSPWNNDPVRDSGGEAFYIRDEERGHYWSPMPLPCRGSTPYVTRHGFGYSAFEHTERGIRTEAWVYVALDASVKFTVIKIANESGRPRQLSVTGFVEWVLGDLRPKTAMHIVTEMDPATGALFARNGYSMDFPGRVAFFDTDGAARGFCGDRGEFIGRNGSLRNPAAMGRVGLSGRVGAALDPCAAMQVPFELADGEEREIVFRLGAGKDPDEASRLAARFRGPAAAQVSLEEIWRYWDRTLGAVRVDTPDQSLNCIANGWLVYQTIACRMWGRSGYYQSGGAFGFRDQLQDSMALVYAEPRLSREQLLLCAARQFVDGDVQHWWHPPTGRGVRTRCSDDLLWLPFAVSRYVLSTGDTGVLDESIPFIEGRQVNPEEDSYFDLPNRSRENASLFQHCQRAIARAERFGAHGLPLIGTGDWNDGMNLVGAGGKGESVWLGFFLYRVLMDFGATADIKGEAAYAVRCREEAAKLGLMIEESAWDGEWYRRAYFDDGSPLGTSTNPECRIDSISQSWSVLSGAGDAKRSHIAMESVLRHLVQKDEAIVRLLSPPLDKSTLNPGYIKGYLPGVRENGGQYTHAAVWAAMAFAKLGDAEHAWELASMINPINHATTPEAAAIYKVEPYVAAADVYAVPPHTGRGGWTWYTGSAGWMYRLILESILGLRIERDKLTLQPCFPEAWPGFRMRYRYHDTFYNIRVERVQAEGNPGLSLDGQSLDGGAIRLVDDGRDHAVELRISFLGKDRR